MKRPLLTLCATLASLLASIALAQPAHKSADFAGGLNQLQLSQRQRLAAADYDDSLFSCFTCENPSPVGGHLIYDSSLPILPAVGPTNIFSIQPIDGVPHSAIFEFNIGPLQFHLGDAGIQGGPAIQYNNAIYNGLFFVEDFASPNGTPLRISVQGPTISLRRRTDNALMLNGGFLNVGANGLTNIQDFDPASVIPEPETYALLLAGLGLLGFVARRRTINSRPATSSA